MIPQIKLHMFGKNLTNFPIIQHSLDINQLLERTLMSTTGMNELDQKKAGETQEYGETYGGLDEGCSLGKGV